MIKELHKICVALVVGLLMGVSFAAGQSLPRGTEIRLILLKDLNSGGSVINEEVPFSVAEDVVVAGKVILPEGTIIAGVVKQVRREGALSATVFDKPARLAVEFDTVEDVDGNKIDLKARLNGKQQRLYQFNRDNTKVKKDKERDEILRTSEGLRVGQLLVDTLRGARNFSDLPGRAEETAVMEIARRLKLFNTVDLIRHKRLLDLVAFGAKLATPGMNTLLGARVALGAVSTTFRAAREVAQIATHFPGFLSRKFGGRNINAPMGLELSVFAG